MFFHLGIYATIFTEGFFFGGGGDDGHRKESCSNTKKQCVPSDAAILSLDMFGCVNQIFPGIRGFDTDNATIVYGNGA